MPAFVAESITVDALRARLEKGERLSVLDVRPKKEFEAWRVPGALHCPAEDDLALGQPGPVKTFDLLPRDRPVVVVDSHGKHAALATQTLLERGYHASSLAGGMDAWSLAWNVAEVAMTRGEATIFQVRRTGKGCLSYVIGSGDECVVVDPSVDVAVYRDLARQHGWSIRHILETHVHTDHLSRAPKLASLTHAKVHVPRSERFTLHATERVEEGAKLHVGASEIVALRTPGHTPESTCYLVDKHALLTGDTLLLDGVAKLDLETDVAQARKRAADLHTSAQRLLALPPATFILPGHASPPIAFDRQAIVGTVKQVRERVPTLGLKREEFVARLARELPPVTEAQRAIARANEQGATTAVDPAVEAGPHASARSLGR